ncbi:uncharacterized protein [Clytia hemisphaerica]|uniref:uncharacterized protein n=1 Tax=Clytia hemisphaerica TaxID=252671 RepID=UPI0034D4761D
MGRQALVSHASGSKHKELNVKIQTFFNPKSKKSVQKNPSTSEQTSSASQQTPGKKVQTTLEVVTTYADVVQAEICWALKCIDAGYSYNSCSDVGKIFNHIFPCPITKDFSLGSTKLMYMTNFGLAPYFKTCLMDRIMASPCFVLSYDESLNAFNQKSEMDILIRYFDETDKLVKTRYFDSCFLGHATSADLKNNLDESVKKLDTNKLVQIGMDGPNVNLSLLKLVQEERELNQQHRLIDIGSCGIHTIHNAFKVGTESSDWGLKKILKGSFQLFHDSPARREDYIKKTECKKFPSSFCATRWIEDRPVADRLVELWPNMVKMVNHWESLSRSKRPSSKSYQNVLKGVNDYFTPAKLNFFSYLADIFKPFLTKYQKLLTSKKGDEALKEYTEFIEEIRSSHLNDLLLFDRTKMRLDHFYFNVLGAAVEKCKSFSFVLKVVLTLSHGQAAVERGFSVGKASMRINISDESIVAKKIVKDYLLSNKIDISNYSPPSKLVLSCKSAHTRYKASLQEKADSEAKDALKEKRELLQKEIDELVAKESKIKKTCQSLDSDFVNLVSEAEKRPNEMVSLITKANALKRRQNELNEDLDDLHMQIKAKRQKLK